MDASIETISESKIKAQNVNVFYAEKQALFGVSLDINDKSVTSLIGPSGCGKSTFLRCFNRMNDVIPSCGLRPDHYGWGWPKQPKNWPGIVAWLTLIFETQPLPENRIWKRCLWAAYSWLGHQSPGDGSIVEDSLKKAGLWKEVSDRLNDQATGLSGGQQQRLCIARAIAVGPDVLLMDEPCSALDPIATSIIEELIGDLQNRLLFWLWRIRCNRLHAFHKNCLLPSWWTDWIWRNQGNLHEAQNEQTEAYISGKIG